MTQATRRTTAILLAMVGVSLAGAQADGLKDFFIQAPAPEGWKAASLERRLPDLGADVLAMWERETEHGRACIYILGKRIDRLMLLEVTANVFAGNLDASGIDFKQFPDTSVMGVTAARFAAFGRGDGRMLTALDENTPDNQDTYMELLMLTRYWADGKGTDFIEFAVGCPDADKRVIVPQFRKMVAGCSFTGQYGKAGATPAPVQPVENAPTPRAGAQPAAPVTRAPDATARPRSMAAEVAAVKALGAAGFSTYWPTDKDAAYDLLAVSKDGSRVVKLAMAVANPLAKPADPLIWKIPVERGQSADGVLLTTDGGTELWLVPFEVLRPRGKVEDGVLTLVGSDMGADEATVYEFLQDYRDLAKTLAAGK